MITPAQPVYLNRTVTLSPGLGEAGKTQDDCGFGEVPFGRVLGPINFTYANFGTNDLTNVIGQVAASNHLFLSNFDVTQGSITSSNSQGATAHIGTLTPGQGETISFRMETVELGEASLDFTGTHSVGTFNPVECVFPIVLLPITITGTKWDDENGNGNRDGGESGVGGVTIYNDANNNGALDNDEPATTTGGDGSYELIINPSDPTLQFTIREVLPDGAFQTYPGGSDGFWAGTINHGDTISKADFGNTFNQYPIAQFTATPTSGRTPLIVSFDASTSTDPDGSISNYDWDFGDSNTATGITTSHTFEEAGNYIVTLTITDDNGAIGTATETISVDLNLAPMASFTQSPTIGKAPLTVSFDASASSDPDGSIDTHSWDFGDSNTATGITTSHTFEEAGNYIVTLTVTDDNGASDTATGVIVVSPNQAPIASFTADKTSGKAPLTVSFDASASSDPDGSIDTHSWDFGDSNMATGITTSHTFEEAGNYIVTLTVTDDNGATNSTSQTITVSPNQTPTASFTSSPTTGEVSLTVSFNASASNDPDGSIDTYSWNFGDNSSGSGLTTSHTFTSAGIFTVTLTVTDDNGATNSTSQTITVTPAATLSYSLSRSFSSHTQESSYRLVALPGNSNVGLASTLPGSSGEHNDWRAFYNNGSSGSKATYLVEYDGSDAFTFKPGRGFWLLSKNTWSPSATISSVPLAQDGTYAITVHSGWNIISNPFDVNIAWSAVQALNNLGSAVLRRFNGSFSTTTTFATAETTGEAFYFNNEAGLSQLKLPYPGLATTAEVEPLPRSEQVLTLTAYREGERASSVQVGLASEAQHERDGYDQVAPPSDFEAASLRLHNTALTTSDAGLSSEFRPLGSPGEAFMVSLQSTGEAPLEVHVEEIEGFEGEEIYLVEELGLRSYDLKTEQVITVPMGSVEHRYRLLIGASDYVAQAREALLPEEASLLGNYPNPFRDRTVVEYVIPASQEDEAVSLQVYNVLGQRVRVLVKGAGTSGYHRVAWDGRDGSGAEVASGVYVYRIQVGRYSAVRQMLFLK